MARQSNLARVLLHEFISQRARRTIFIVFTNIFCEKTGELSNAWKHTNMVFNMPLNPSSRTRDSKRKPSTLMMAISPSLRKIGPALWRIVVQENINTANTGECAEKYSRTAPKQQWTPRAHKYCRSNPLKLFQHTHPLFKNHNTSMKARSKLVITVCMQASMPRNEYWRSTEQVPDFQKALDAKYPAITRSDSAKRIETLYREISRTPLPLFTLKASGSS